jgi:glutathione S-transferase
MRSLLYTSGYPFARGVRIMLHELGLDYARNEALSAPGAEDPASAPTLQVPVLRDGAVTLWESGTIAEYLLATYPERPAATPPLAQLAFRPEEPWRDRLVFSTIQTFGTVATTISQMTWTGVGVTDNAHLTRSAEKLGHILAWLEAQIGAPGEGFLPGCVSIQDIFVASHVRFIQARPLGVDVGLDRFPRIAALLERLDERASFKANPIWWWEPGVTGYEPDGTPVFGDRN